MASYALRLAVCMAVLHAAFCLYTRNDDVVQLSASNFDKIVMQPDGVAMVEFYAPWCGHCKKLAPHFKTAATKLKGIVTVGAIDCDSASGRPLCAQMEIQGFPTVKLFGPGRVRDPTGKDAKSVSEYTGPRTAKGLFDGAAALVSGAHVTSVGSVEEFEAFQLSKPELPKVLLFTDKSDTPLMFKGISDALHRWLDFGVVRERASDVAAMHGVDAFPTVLVATPDGSTHTYDGELKAHALRAFLAEFSEGASAADAAGSSSGRDSGDSGRGGDGDASTPSSLLNGSMADAAEMDAVEGVALLALYMRPGGDGTQRACDASLQAFASVINGMGHVVKTLLVDVQQEDLHGVARYGVSPDALVAAAASDAPCQPTVVLLPWGEGKEELDEYEVYQGEMEPKALQTWVTEALPDDLVTVVTASVFAEFITTPDDGSPMGMMAGAGVSAIYKMMLFSSKDDIPGVYKALAANFRSSFGFGIAPTSDPQNKVLMSKLGVTKAPTLVCIAMEPKEVDGASMLEPNVVQYMGALKYNAMATWVAGIALNIDQTGGKRKSLDSDEAIAELVPQVTNAASFNQHCVDASGICILLLLDPSSASHAAMHKALAHLAIERDGQPFGFCWLDATAARGVGPHFGLMRSDVPAAVALSARRMRYATLPSLGAPADLRTNLSPFMDGVLSGKVRTESIDALPSVVPGDDDGDGGSGDGGDAEEEAAVVEEEFDLSDIMNEEVDEAQQSAEERLRKVDAELKAEAEAAAEASKSSKSSKKSSKKKSKKKAKKKDEL